MTAHGSPTTTGRVGHVAWTAYGPLDAPGTPVLLLHGVTDSGACWPGVVAHLSQRETRPVVALDARGHGRSGLPDEPFTIAALAAETAAVVREVLGRPVLAVGHSMGGLTAQELALTEPDLVVGLVLEDPAWRRDRRVTGTGALDWLPQAVAEAAVRTQEEMEARSRAENPHWPDDEHAPWAESALAISPRLCDVPHEWDGRDWIESMGGVRVPVTLVTGEVERGAIVDEARVARVTELLGAAPEGLLTHVHVPGVGHSIRRDDRQAFLAALDGALGRLP